MHAWRVLEKRNFLLIFRLVCSVQMPWWWKSRYSYKSKSTIAHLRAVHEKNITCRYDFIFLRSNCVGVCSYTLCHYIAMILPDLAIAKPKTKKILYLLWKIGLSRVHLLFIPKIHFFIHRKISSLSTCTRGKREKDFHLFGPAHFSLGYRREIYFPRMTTLGGLFLACPVQYSPGPVGRLTHCMYRS